MVNISLRQQGPFFIRLKDNRLAKFAQNNKKRPLKEFFSSLKGNHELYFHQKIVENDLTIAGKRTKDNQLLIVCSNTKNPDRILSTYKKRWLIETCFRNMKSQGFNLENTHMTNLDRLSKLMSVVSVAMLLVSLAGINKTCPFKKTVDTFLYSIFTLGLRTIQHDYQGGSSGLFDLIMQAAQDLLKSEG